MKIGIDINGGDFAPDSIIKGAILAKKEIKSACQLVLFGNEKQIVEKLVFYGASPDDYTIVNCNETIEMGDDPVKSFFEKTDSGMTKGFYQLKDDLIDGFASAGNTGAMLVGATKVVGVTDGILRPCISSYYPNNLDKRNLLVDVGLNADPKPENLLQYALLGDLFARTIMKIQNPRVGLLNIGEEESKGNVNSKATFQLLKNSPNLNFIGNIEGGDLHKAELVDVIVTDGFTGNIVLKQAESFYNILSSKNIHDSYFDNYNYENYGGTPVLGINKTVVVGHGKSNDKAIKNMILLTAIMIESKISEKITKAFKYGTN